MTINACISTTHGWATHLSSIPEANIPSLLLSIYLSELFFTLSTSLAKLSILFFYLRLAVTPTYRRIIYISIAFITVWAVVFSCVVIFVRYFLLLHLRSLQGRGRGNRRDWERELTRRPAMPPRFCVLEPLQHFLLPCRSRTLHSWPHKHHHGYLHICSPNALSMAYSTPETPTNRPSRHLRGRLSVCPSSFRFSRLQNEQSDFPRL